MSSMDFRKVIEATKPMINKISSTIGNLPSDPKELALIAVSSGETSIKLAVCYKLTSMFRDLIPMLTLSAKSPEFVDQKNHQFEQELTISSRFPSNSITTVFSCVLAAIGVHPMSKFLAAPSSPNPFAQCLRAVHRLAWFIRTRHRAIRGIIEQNQVSVICNSLRLASFPDLSTSAQRAAIFSAICAKDKVNLRMFAYLIPRRFLTDSTAELYTEFVASLSDERKEELADLEVEVNQIIISKMNPSFLSARGSIDDSFVADLIQGPSLDESERIEYLTRCFLFEIAPDKERDAFTKEFENASKKAAQLNLRMVKRHFEMVHVINADVPPKDYTDVRASSTLSEKGKESSKVMTEMFKTKRDFISETRKFRT